MPDHEVQQGECLSSIAHRYGISDWRQLWEHPDNAALREHRNPHILKPGDVVKIPDDVGPAFEGCSGESGAFRLTSPPPTTLQLNLTDAFGNPYAHKEYELDVDGQVQRGTTAENGRLCCEIAPDAASATLTLWLDSAAQAPDRKLVWTLDLGHLDPIEELTGVQARLKSLGYGIDEISGSLDEPTRRALRMFQAEERLPITGEADEATVSRLARRYEDREESV
ncbi:MAG: peptidoglycan-binding protein [candidate division Zixibacteria bacterium]|jgi:N-acetylmuramoyl-L-alanine amidase|nr:peptidoglycan-binding protein [candidate division Zixibacteria bacterium]